MSNVKIQPKSTSRRVCLQQNKTASSNNSSTIPSNYLLINNGITSNTKRACVTLPILPSLLKTTQITSLKPSLKQLNNTPTTTTTTKSVRFNFPLTQILHFYTPPSFDDEEDSSNEEEDFDDEEVEENELEDAFLELFSSRYSLSDYDSNLYHPAIQQHLLDDASTNKLTLVLSNWPTTHPTRRFITQMVSLENLSWDNARSTIKGCVLVHNLAFQKRVTIRMSFNRWQTWIDIDANYKETSKGNALDRFTFELVTPNHLSYLNRINSGSSCYLAVRYQVNGREFWDNNNEKNFNLEWVGTPCENNITSHFESSLASNKEESIISLYQQQHGNFNSTISGYYNENQLKKEEYYMPLTSNNQSTTTSNNYYPSQQQQQQSTNKQQASLLVSLAQQQISAHFQLYLERKRRSEERLKQQDTSIQQSTSTSSLIQSGGNEQVVLLSI